ncbi:hypothetical protein [Thiocapsa imhoffii]|nr:hypothetical protein [Thiocapsa imhoffii]
MKLCFLRRWHGRLIREAERLLAGDEAGASSPESKECVGLAADLL